MRRAVLLCVTVHPTAGFLISILTGPFGVGLVSKGKSTYT